MFVMLFMRSNWLEYMCEGSDAGGIVRKGPCPVLVIHEEKVLQAA
jgi:hypothetical protein